MKQSSWLLILLVFWLAACTPLAEAPDATLTGQATAVAPSPQPTSLPTAIPTKVAATRPFTPPPPTAVPTAPPPEPTIEPAEEPNPESAVIAGRTAEGAFFLGNPDAPVTMIDYSDFL